MDDKLELSNGSVLYRDGIKNIVEIKPVEKDAKRFYFMIRWAEGRDRAIPEWFHYKRKRDAREDKQKLIDWIDLYHEEIKNILIGVMGDKNENENI